MVDYSPSVRETEVIYLLSLVLSLRASWMKHGGCLLEQYMLRESRSPNRGVKCMTPIDNSSIENIRDYPG